MSESDDKPMDAATDSRSEASRDKSNSDHPASKVSGALGKEQHPPSTKDCKEPSKEQKHWLEYGAFVAALIAAIGAIAAAILAGWQACIARDAEQRQLRAYVTIDIPKQFVRLSDEGRPVVHVSVKVLGQTPAYEVVMKSGLTIGNWPVSKDDHFHEADPTKTPAFTYYPGVNADEGITRFLDSGISRERFETALLGRGERPLFFGTIHYRDAFGVDRYTRFCLGIVGSLKDNSLAYDRCSHYNDSN
jgi:hypothetical protein